MTQSEAPADPVVPTAPLSAAAIARLRGELGRKGMAVNEKLTRLMAGQNATLATIKLPNELKAGLTPIEKLRRFLDLIIRAQRRLGTPAWGHCASCGCVLPQAALDDTPWLEVCGDCAAR